MKGLVYTRRGAVELLDVPEPTPGPGEVVADVMAVGICGSDIHGVRDGGLMRVPPLIMGHELSVRTGSGTYAVNPMVSCGACPQCQAGNDQLCVSREIIGITRAGGFAERVAVPSALLVELPPAATAVDGALVEPLAVAVHAVNLAAPDEGDRVAILGAGNIGLLAVSLARRRGATVTAVDPLPDRLALAQRMGATQVGPLLEGTYDAVVDAAGTAASRAAAIAHLRAGGHAVWLGNATAESGFDAQDLVRRQLRITGSAAYTAEEFREAAGMIDSIELDWVTVVGLDDGPEVFARLMAEKGRPELRVVIQPGARA